MNIVALELLPHVFLMCFTITINFYLMNLKWFNRILDFFFVCLNEEERQKKPQEAENPNLES